MGRAEDGWEKGREQRPNGKAEIEWEQVMKESRSWREQGMGEQGMKGTGTESHVWSCALTPAHSPTSWW